MSGNAKQKCRVWGTINAIFVAQDQIYVDLSGDANSEQDIDMIAIVWIFTLCFARNYVIPDFQWKAL